MQYFHFVGGKYTPAQFVKEAKRFGISRRAPANVAKGMNFGDTVILLNWRQGRPAAFAEFYITKIHFDSDIAEAVSEAIKDRYDVEYIPPSGGGGSVIARECGSFIDGGCFVVTSKDGKEVTLAELVEIAEQKNAEKNGDAPLWVMVGGKLGRVFSPPQTVLVNGAYPNFTRGFMRVSEGAQFVETPPAEVERTFGGVRSYKKRTAKERTDLLERA